MSRLFAKVVEYFGPYPYTRHALPSPGSQNLTFLQDAQPRYNPIGAGWAPTGEPGWGPAGQPGYEGTFYFLPPQKQILTFGAMNLPQLVGLVGPGGYATGQVFNPPLLDTGTYSG